MSVDIQTIITITSLLLNIKEVHGWFTSRTIQQKATVLWHVYSTMSDTLLATLWWCMRADGSINRPPSTELGHNVGFSQWTTGAYAYVFWAVIGVKLLTQFPALTRTRRQQLSYLTFCYAVTVTAHFPFIGCVLTEVGWDGRVIALGVVCTAVCYVVWLLSELTFRLQAPDPFSAAHTELVSTMRFCVEWFYLMIMVLPFSNWQLQLPDYFLLGYAVRVLLWLAYTAVMSKASATVEEVEWLMFRPAKGGRPGEYEEVGQLEEQRGQVPLRMPAAAAAASDDSGSSDDDDDDDEDGSGEDDSSASTKRKPAAKVLTKSLQVRDNTSQPTARTSDGRRSNDDDDSGSSARQQRAASRGTGRTAQAGVQVVKDAKATGSGSGGSGSGGSGGGVQEMVDVRGSDAVEAQVNGETVILIKKPKAPATAATLSSSSGSNTSGGNGSGPLAEAVHALDIHETQKKGR